jgi:hypothetical protein
MYSFFSLTDSDLWVGDIGVLFLDIMRDPDLITQQFLPKVHVSPNILFKDLRFTNISY